LRIVKSISNLQSLLKQQQQLPALQSPTQPLTSSVAQQSATLKVETLRPTTEQKHSHNVGQGPR
jgi:hypothetical protein